MTWAQEEFKTLNLADERLNARTVLLAERLAAKPTESIPNACSGWAETQAAYRFLEQPTHRLAAVLQPHWDCSIERMRGHPVVLNIQDTTELDFNGRSTGGLGPLSYEAQRGMYLHPTYAITPDREPLGVLDAWMWARQPKAADKQREGVKESLRWIEGYERVAERARQLPEVRQVYVADREADILALLLKARDWEHAADYLIRCQHERALPQDGEGGKLWQRLGEAPVLGQLSFELPAGRGRKARRFCIGTNNLRAGRRNRCASRRQARSVATAEQPDGGHAGASGRADRLVPGTLGDRAVLPDPQGRLPHRSLATGRGRAHRDSACPVLDRGLADQPADAPGPILAAVTGRALVRQGRMAGSVCAEQKETAQGSAAVEYGGAAGGANRGMNQWRAKQHGPDDEEDFQHTMVTDLPAMPQDKPDSAAPPAGPRRRSAVFVPGQVEGEEPEDVVSLSAMQPTTPQSATASQPAAAPQPPSSRPPPPTASAKPARSATAALLQRPLELGRSHQTGCGTMAG
ncbi:hypothetical protein FQA39_LY19350 [Lamprigera yunnana]|nr:hypothetical protein FQA39_LY19350 [Lamprigera yunnana]